ncbi:DUF5810 domain-containing protein [Halosimplex salinum]|uniref:DUF5810 domain-containing protein n=1 Tax=Halosimplex salinum TaxID=1710538 RepID=UPI000F489A66|nr:DUF5810 domain-containing protein [Halosimplex salinum]
MGYACPVCDDPQADAEHLANHLAFTAMLRGEGHEAWLDDHVDGWADLAPEELAERVADRADEEEFPQVFEDTTGGAEAGHEHDHGSHGGHAHDHGRSGRSPGSTPDAIDSAAPGGVADLDDFEGETDDVLAEARELTRKRRENTGDEVDATDGEAESNADADAGADADDETESS